MKLLKPQEVCEILGCSLSKLRGLPIPYIEVGGQRRYELSDLNEYKTRNKILPKEISCQLPKGRTPRSTNTISQSPEGDIEERWKQQAAGKRKNSTQNSALLRIVSSNSAESRRYS